MVRYSSMVYLAAGVAGLAGAVRAEPVAAQFYTPPTLELQAFSSAAPELPPQAPGMMPTPNPLLRWLDMFYANRLGCNCTETGLGLVGEAGGPSVPVGKLDMRNLPPN